MDNMEKSKLKCEMIWKIWKKGKSNSEKNMKNMEENLAEYWKDLKSAEEMSVE